MARKSRKNVPINVSVPSGNLTSQAVMELDKETKPYQVAVYARLSHESEANRERDTVETQISYIKNYVAEQPDMVVVDIYADVSVSGTTFERPEFERMMQDIRAGRVNTVITRDLSRLGRNYVESGNYIERVFPFLDVRFIAITDDFDTARPGTDLSMPLKNIVNEYYSKDLSEKVSTGKRAIWLKGEFCEFLVPYGYRKENKHLVVNEETRENVVHIFEWFLEGRGYNEIARMLEEGGNLSPQKYRLMESGKEEAAQKAKGWTGDRVKKILGEEYYIGNSVHGRQRRALETGRKNILTPPETWVRIENTHEPIIDKDTFYKVQEEIKRRTEKNRKKCQPRVDLPTPPENKFKRKIYCAECGKTFTKRRWYKDKFYYTCRSHHSFREVCQNSSNIFLSDMESNVFEVIRQHMTLCVDKLSLIRKLNGSPNSVKQYEIYAKEIARLQKEQRRIAAKKNGLYEDYREQLISAEELCQYKAEYEKQEEAVRTQIAEIKSRQCYYEKNFHMDKEWEEIVDRYFRKRKLSQDMVDAFVDRIIVHSNSEIEVRLIYDDMLTELLEISAEVEASHGE